MTKKERQAAIKELAGFLDLLSRANQSFSKGIAIDYYTGRIDSNEWLALWIKCRIKDLEEE